MSALAGLRTSTDFRILGPGELWLHLQAAASWFRSRHTDQLFQLEAICSAETSVEMRITRPPSGPRRVDEGAVRDV